MSQAADQAGCPGRAAWLGAGGPEHVPAVTIDRRCGSSQQAVHFAAQGIMAGAYDIAIAGGIESMSRVPLGSARMGVDPFGTLANRRYEPGLVSQGVAAELIAAHWGLSRTKLDEYAARSHQRAARAQSSGAFEAEIVPISVEGEAGITLVEQDEGIRPDSTAEGLAKLRPAFESAESSARFPEINWSVTAGNSSQVSDVASAALIMSERKAEELSLTPMARIHSMAVCGSDPIMMLTGPIPVTERIIKRSGVSLDDISHFEVNEAFSAIPLVWQHEFGVDDDRLNPQRRRHRPWSSPWSIGCEAARDASPRFGGDG